MTEDEGVQEPLMEAIQVDGSEVASTLRGFGHGWQGQHNSTNAVVVPDEPDGEEPTFCLDNGQGDPNFGKDVAFAVNTQPHQSVLTYDEDALPDTVGTLCTNTGPNGHDAGNFCSNQGVDGGYVIPVYPDDGGSQAELGAESVSNALRTPGGEASTPMILDPTPIPPKEPAVNDAVDSIPAEGYAPETARTLTAGTSIGSNPPGRRGEDDVNLVVPPSSEVQALTSKGDGSAYLSEQAPALQAGGGMPGQGYAAVLEGEQGAVGADGKVVGRPAGAADEEIVMAGEKPEPKQKGVGRVRRLLPEECEALQGWPRGHTSLGHDGKEMPDSTRYRQAGNGVAAVVARFVGERIAEIESELG